MKPILMPQIKKFDDLFDKYIKYELNMEKPEWAYERHFIDYKNEPAVQHIGPFCNSSNNEALYVRAKPDVIETVLSNTLEIEDDTITFGLHYHKNDHRVLVTAGYNKIIGNIYLAFIEPESCPKEEWK